MKGPAKISRSRPSNNGAGAVAGLTASTRGAFVTLVTVRLWLDNGLSRSSQCEPCRALSLDSYQSPSPCLLVALWQSEPQVRD
jgi:hypothetical protein